MIELDANEFQRKKESLESQLRTTKSRCETLDFEIQVLRKESESKKPLETAEDVSSKLNASEARFFELKSKFDLLLAQHEQLKLKAAELGDRSFIVHDQFSGSGEMKYENDRLKLEIGQLLKRNEELSRVLDSLKGQGETGNNTQGLSLQEHKIKSLQKLLEDSCAVNEKNLKEINSLKRENQEIRQELEILRKATQYQHNNYNSNRMNDTSFMLNRTVTYELEAENESLKHKLSSLELMISEYKTKFIILQNENEALKREESNKKLKLSGDGSLEAELLKSRLNTNELLLNDYKQKFDQAQNDLNSLRNENALLKAEIEELSKVGRNKVVVSGNADILNRSFRENSGSLNRTFQLELEMENETLKKNLNSMETMLQDYKNNVRSYFDKTQMMERQITDLLRENQTLKDSKKFQHH